MTHRTEPPHIPTLEEVDTAAFRRTSIEHWHNNDLTIQRTSLDRLLVEVELTPETALIRDSWKAEPTGYTYQAPFGPPYAPMLLRDPSVSL